MRIGIDARFYGRIGKGLGRYVSELIAHLERLDRTNEYVVFLRRENWDDYVPSAPNFRKVLADVPWYGIREQVVLPWLLLRERIDLAHFPHFNVPILCPTRFVMTVHDLILLRFPTARATTLGPLLFKTKFLLYRLVIGIALRRARTVFAVSEHTKDALLAEYPFLRARPPVVTYPACGTPFRGARSAAAPAVPTPYALYVGNAYPHKNLDRLVDAFAEFRKHRPDYRLAIVGGGDHFHRRLETDARATGRDHGVHFLGTVTDGELAALYDHAAFYVFPSLYEGFGLPPLEAMCRGVPVASSDATCLPEILGDAVRYFDAASVPAIADAMLALASDDALREELRRRGTDRAKRFDWNETARITLSHYA
jgi:glycosyltransferase involved in cell wall biosynthesis